MKKQLFVVLLLLVTQITFGAASGKKAAKCKKKTMEPLLALKDVLEAQGEKFNHQTARSLVRINAILAEKHNFQFRFDESRNSVIRSLYAAKSIFESGDLGMGLKQLDDARSKGAFVIVDIPGKGTYELSRMIAAIIFDNDPFVQ